MELTWMMRLRIAAAMALGVVLLGVFGWQFWGQNDAACVSLSVAGIPFKTAAVYFAFAFLCGFISYFLAWPYGREIAVLAVPSGLGFWALKTADMSMLLRFKFAAEQRLQLYNFLRWEGVFWFALVAAGFAGVIAAELLTRSQSSSGQERRKAPVWAYPVAVVISALIAGFCIKLFAKDVYAADRQFGWVIAQPQAGQIAFAVMFVFALAAFAAKKTLNVDYISSIVATLLVSFWAMNSAGGAAGYMTGNWPIGFFANPAGSILPVQIISFGALGSVAGYWIAVAYTYHNT